MQSKDSSIRRSTVILTKQYLKVGGIAAQKRRGGHSSGREMRNEAECGLHFEYNETKLGT